MKALRKFLEEQGFHFSENHFKVESNDERWMAYRRSKIPARPCECNSDKIGMQIVVTPYSTVYNSTRCESVEIDLCGEFNGVWWKMFAYSLSPKDAVEKFPKIERSLIAAWNAMEAE